MHSIFHPGWLLLLASAILQGCAEAPAAAPAPPRQVVTLTLEAEPLVPSFALAGRTLASEVSQVRPQVGGIVTGQLFREGSLIQAGQPLYQIDDSLFRARVEEARANLDLARATLDSTRLQAERFARLVDSGGISRQELDNARAAHAQARASVAANQALLDSARTNLAYTRVVAPIAGRIGRSSVTRGALVTASQPEALATIRQLDPIHVDLTQSIDDYLALRRSLAREGLATEEVAVRLHDAEGRELPHSGSMAFSDMSVDESTASVTLRAVFANPDEALLPGMYVRAQVDAGKPLQALLVPQERVMRDALGTPWVWVVDDAGQVGRRDLRLGAAQGNRWQVLAGLEPGARLVVEGLHGLREGMTVEAVGSQRLAQR